MSRLPEQYAQRVCSDFQDSVIEKSEDQQFAAAIAASLKEGSAWSRSRDESSEEKDDDIESFEYSDDESCTAKVKRESRNEDKTFLTNEINKCAKRIKENSLDKNRVETKSFQVFEEGEDDSKVTGIAFKLLLSCQYPMSIKITLSKRSQSYSVTHLKRVNFSS